MSFNSVVDGNTSLPDSVLPYILSKLESVENALDEIKEEIKELREDVSELREQHARTDTAVSFLRNGINNIKKDIGSLEEDLDDVESQHVEYLRDWKSLALDFSKLLVAAFLALLVNNYLPT